MPRGVGCASARDGGRGALGQALVPALEHDGHDVRRLDFRPLPGGNFVGDIRDRELVRTLVDGVDAVAHLAALHGVHTPHWSPEEFWTTNVEGTRTVYDACRERGVRHVALASSAAVYGVPPAAPGEPWPGTWPRDSARRWHTYQRKVF